MSQWLKHLVTKELSFCKKGACPDAVIDIYKSIDPEPEPHAGIMDMVRKLAETVGIIKAKDPETVITPEPVQKTVFADNWATKKLKNNFYDALWALEDSFYQIQNDEKITDKIAEIKAAIGEFTQVLTGELGDINVKKNLEVRDQMILPIREQIVKIFEPEENSEKGGQDDMNEEQIKKMVEDITKSVTDSITGQLPEIVKQTVSEQMKPVQDEIGKVSSKVEEIGKMASGSQQPEGDVHKNDKNFWEGAL